MRVSNPVSMVLRSRRTLAPLAIAILSVASLSTSIADPRTSALPRQPASSTNAPAFDPGWAFRPIRRSPVPPPPASVNRAGGVSLNPIDAWTGASLRKAGIEPNPEASPRSLLRRVYFDLIGLPPTLQEVAAFEKDHSPQAWSRVVDRLLAMPQYGERWARHWLDVARFAQSNGYERDGEKLFAWRYRDYVVAALNADKPYDQFVREQLSGDEWVSERRASRRGEGGATGLSTEERDAIVATGFLRLGVSDDEPDDKLQAEFDELDDMASSTGAAFLGLTLGCARCHDHKFDPIAQSDYYSLISFFRSLRTTGKATQTLESSTYLPLASPEELGRWRRDRESELKQLTNEAAGATGDAKKTIEAKIAKLKEAQPPFDWALAGCEREDAIPVVQVLSRGNPRSPGAETPPAFLKTLSNSPPVVRAIAGDRPSSGRRRALADWVASSDNPLTARVIVNRVWHHHFGRGIVKTTTDFGRVGSPPTHPELLDWLASEFMREGWSIKKLHRQILTSETWKRSSSVEQRKAQSIDPGNDLLWRQNLRRLDAEALRDTVLSISGRLNLKSGGRGFFPHLSGEVLAGGSRPGTDWEVSAPEEQSRRSLYAYVRRTSMPPMMEAFDYNNATSPLGERTTTTVAPQALMLLNDSFLHDQASAWAERLLRESVLGAPGVAVRGSQSMEGPIRRAWEQATARSPRPAELKALGEFIKRERRRLQDSPEVLYFRPDVSDTLSIPYFIKLPADQFLVGPSSNEGWSYFKGRWPREYEGNKNMEEGRGPFALWGGVDTLEFSWSGEWILNPACESVSLLFGMKADDNGESGFEASLRPRSGDCELRRLEPARSFVVAKARLHAMAADRMLMRVERMGSRVRVWLGGGADPLIDASDVGSASARGKLGVRVWGAGAALDRARLRLDGRETRWSPPQSREAVERRALESACLLLLNLNELCYVD
ncbi:MAG: DUF1553 domain-containing protein [Verrucomicrobia bacterium]|nr:DUF1553 domain-containing protein [Verrucomicrobiota bacterium]